MVLDDYNYPNLFNQKGWICPVCNIGLAPTCQVCTECLRHKARTVSDVAIDESPITNKPIPRVDWQGRDIFDSVRVDSYNGRCVTYKPTVTLIDNKKDNE